MSTAPEIIAEFSDWEGMRQALRTRWQQTGESSAHLSEFMGLPDDFLGKLLSINPERNITKHTLGTIMSGLRVKAVLVIDEEAVKRFENRTKQSNRNLIRVTHTHYTMTSKKWASIRKQGPKARMAKLTPEERSKLMRKVAKARWRKPKIIEINPTTGQPIKPARPPAKSRKPNSGTKGRRHRRERAPSPDGRRTGSAAPQMLEAAV